MALSQSASSQNASAPEADSQNTVEKIIDQLKNDPYTLRIVLIAAIIIIGIWLCVFIALRRKKNAQKNEDSNGASNSSEETLKKTKRADMSDSKDSDNGFADPDKNKDEKYRCIKKIRDRNDANIPASFCMRIYQVLD